MKSCYSVNSPSDIGQLLQESRNQWLNTTRRWVEVLTVDPSPPIGCSPKDVIWRKNKSKLYRYRNFSGIRFRTPVLFVYALINKPYILDLTPGMSIIEYLVERGFDVYLLDWGQFYWEDRNLGFADLVHDYIRQAVIRVARTSGSEEISLVGYCMGGTLSTMYTALYAKPRIRNLIYIASPLDFEEAGIAGRRMQSPGFDVDRVVETLGLIPRDLVDCGLRMLNPVNNYIGTYSRLWRMLDDGGSVEAWKLLNKWMIDGINFPGQAFRDWVKDFYQNNALIQDQIYVRGQRVELSRIQSNILALSGLRDHIVAPHQTTNALAHFGSQETECRQYKVGHGGLVFGKVAREQVFPDVAAWLAEKSESV
jgi:polyhydroxyalkanoate synthase